LASSTSCGLDELVDAPLAVDVAVVDEAVVVELVEGVEADEPSVFAS